MTRKNVSALLAWACLLPGGVRPGRTPEPAAKYAAPHGGILYDFPNKKGSVEIVAEPAKDAPGATKQNSHQIAAYFYEIDGKTPLSARPTDVKVVMGDLAPISLTEGVGEKAGRFVSPPGPYAGEIRGTLTATAGEGPVEVAFSKR